MTVERTVAAISQIEKLAQDIPGWSPPDQLYTLFSMALMTSASGGDILELGSWCGRASVALGLAARMSGATKVYCVDLFPERDDWHQNADGSYSMTITIDGKEIKAYHEQTVWKEPFEQIMAPLYKNNSGILEIFNEKVAQYGLTNVISAYKGTLSDFLGKHPTSRPFRLAFIDGDHSYDAVCNDIRLAENRLAEGGWICFDDAHTSYAGVNQAINELIISNPRYDISQQMTRKLFIARKRA